MFGMNNQVLGYAPSSMAHTSCTGPQQQLHHGMPMPQPGCCPIPGGPNWDPGVVNPFSVGDHCCAPQECHPTVIVEERCPSPIVYVVREGDTLYLIAQKYGRDWRELAGYNHLGNPDLIYPGQHILIPRC